MNAVPLKEYNRLGPLLCDYSLSDIYNRVIPVYIPQNVMRSGVSFSYVRLESSCCGSSGAAEAELLLNYYYLFLNKPLLSTLTIPLVVLL